jgi:hypothetical protein
VLTPSKAVRHPVSTLEDFIVTSEFVP